MLTTERVSRKERERQQHRVEILDAAEKVLAQKGFHAATVQEIAETAEFSVGTLYNFFPGKEELYNALIDHRVEEYFTGLQEAIAGAANPLEKIRAIVRHKILFCQLRRRFITMFFTTVSGGRIGPRLQMTKQREPRYRAYLDYLTSIFAEGIDQGFFVRVDPLALAVGMEGLSDAFIAQWADPESRLPGPDPDLVERLLLEGITMKRQG